MDIIPPTVTIQWIDKSIWPSRITSITPEAIKNNPRTYTGARAKTIRDLLAELPPEGSKRLFELWKKVPPQRPSRDDPLSPLDRLRYLLLRLSEHWDSYRVFDWHRDVPWTNNITEQVIGRMKMRSRTVRGFKSRSGMLHGLWAAASTAC